MTWNKQYLFAIALNNCRLTDQKLRLKPNQSVKIILGGQQTQSSRFFQVPIKNPPFYKESQVLNEKFQNSRNSRFQGAVRWYGVDSILNKNSF